MTRRQCLFSLAPVLLGACATQGPPADVPLDDDLLFLPARPEKGNLFRDYRVDGTARWSRNWTSRFDFSGVAWNDRRTATAVSRQHVVMANHFVRPDNVPLVFHDRRGQPHERWLSGVRRLNPLGDVAVGRLNLPLPDGVAHYGLANPGEATRNRPVLITDQTRAVSIHLLIAIQHRRVMYGFASDLPQVYRRQLVSGDSGNPAFLLREGRLVLLSTHTTGGAGTGPFYGDPEIAAAVRAAIAEG